MKINWNDKYTTVSVYSFIVVCCSIIFYLIASQLNVFTGKISEIIGILQPFIIGFVIAYILNFILMFYEEKLSNIENFESMSKKTKRNLCLIFTYITAFLIIYLFMNFVVPQLIDSVVGLANNIPTYLNNLTVLLDEVMKNLDLDPKYLTLANEKLNEVVNFTIQFATDLLPILGNWVVTIASSVWNIVLGLIVSSYLLIDKERFYAIGKKMVYAISSKRVANRVFELVYRSNYTFGRFLSGKIIDSVIIGILTFVVLSIFKMPYTLLISVIIGITNIIPFFGPFFGAIPSAIIILFVSPIKAVWFLVIILIIQQIDGNIIGPKILGDSIGISAFWILFALLVAGKFFGIVGMVIGVPIFAIIYSIIKEIVEGKLRRKGLPEDTEEYM
ncbi:AI-2E family transporter [Romboutsia ilealis]|uniref:AI-2E family transporter n=1 Tax=Romboutsia faecis TaxID=2764597 RepID=A0ABR7JJZ3_9FIRM|nr:AI-2E family transporter [Romboutsia faecis]MBC5995236.1 AI-2E family transporter [Romboutsia faecis]MRN24515.1 AI-2E family transporter [Romboutsia ilealis]